MLSCYMERLTDVTPDDLRESVQVAVRDEVIKATNDGSLTDLARKSGINVSTLCLIRKDVHKGMYLYTAEAILNAVGKRLVIIDGEGKGTDKDRDEEGM